MKSTSKIAVVGKMHSGKTTLAEALVALGYKRFAFADPVKDVSAEMLNVFSRIMAALTGDTAELPDYDQDSINRMKGNPAIRKLLQLVGTELGREWFGPDTVWINVFENRVREHERYYRGFLRMEPKIVNDDCRFPNEATRLNELGFTIIKLVRDEDERYVSIHNALVKQHPSWTPVMIHEAIEDMQDHPSETNVDLITADIDIASTSVEQLQTLAADIAMGVDICQNLSSS